MGKFDTVVSKTKGAAKALVNVVRGLHGVFATLAKQHSEVASLLERAAQSDEKFVELWPQIRTELLSHERAELRVVYPALRAYSDLRALCDQHEIEAHELENAIASIDNLDPASEARRGEFARLIDMVARHAREEEGAIFPRAQESIGGNESRRLDELFIAAKQFAAELS